MQNDENNADVQFMHRVKLENEISAEFFHYTLFWKAAKYHVEVTFAWESYWFPLFFQNTYRYFEEHCSFN
jgi:hypothetical protein